MSEYKIYQPMKYAVARSMDILKEALNDPDYGIELKVDGASYVLAKDMDCSVHLYGDKISKKTGNMIPITPKYTCAIIFISPAAVILRNSPKI